MATPWLVASVFRIAHHDPGKPSRLIWFAAQRSTVVANACAAPCALRLGVAHVATRTNDLPPVLPSLPVETMAHNPKKVWPTTLARFGIGFDERRCRRHFWMRRTQMPQSRVSRVRSTSDAVTKRWRRRCSSKSDRCEAEYGLSCGRGDPRETYTTVWPNSLFGLKSKGVRPPHPTKDPS